MDCSKSVVSDSDQFHAVSGTFLKKIIMKIKKVLCWLSCFAAVLSLSACNDEDDPVLLESIRFENTEISIKAGES